MSIICNDFYLDFALPLARNCIPYKSIRNNVLCHFFQRDQVPKRFKIHTQIHIGLRLSALYSLALCWQSTSLSSADISLITVQGSHQSLWEPVWFLFSLLMVWSNRAHVFQPFLYNPFMYIALIRKLYPNTDAWLNKLSQCSRLQQYKSIIWIILCWSLCSWNIPIIKHAIGHELSSRISVALSSQLITLRLKMVPNCVKEGYQQGFLRTVTMSNEIQEYMM